MRVFRVPDPLSSVRSATRNEAGVDILLHQSAVRTAPHLDEEQDGLAQAPAPLSFSETCQILNYSAFPYRFFPNNNSMHQVSAAQCP
jgi:hypothetical protein